MAINLLRPTLLIVILSAARKAERQPGSESPLPEFDRWRAPIAQAAGMATGCVAGAYGIGFALGYPVLITVLGALLGFIVIIIQLRNASCHQLWSRSQS